MFVSLEDALFKSKEPSRNQDVSGQADSRTAEPGQARTGYFNSPSSSRIREKTVAIRSLADIRFCEVVTLLLVTYLMCPKS